MHTLGDRMFLENNPFEAVRNCPNLNGLQKIQKLLAVDRSDTEREEINTQAVSILKDPRILAAAVEANRRILTPLWFELLEEGRMDGSIRTEYTRELSELLPLINFWLMPSVFPATNEQTLHKYRFLMEVLAALGLPLLDEASAARTENILKKITSDGGEQT